MEWNIRSSIGEEVSVVNDIAKLLTDKEPKLDEILIAVSEACLNAIEHANQENPDKKVKISLEIEPSQYIVRVYDEGAGFEYRKSEAPQIQMKLREETPRGFGLYLIQKFSEHVTSGYNNEGVYYIELRFRRGE